MKSIAPAGYVPVTFKSPSCGSTDIGFDLDTVRAMSIYIVVEPDGTLGIRGHAPGGGQSKVPRKLLANKHDMSLTEWGHCKGCTTEMTGWEFESRTVHSGGVHDVG